MSPPLHPVLRLIYLLLRGISWLGISVFYRRRIILGREHLQFKGPAIIVVNHPSTLMDVLNSCVHIRQEPFFLANYSLFKHPISRWLLTRLYCIPVKRREDVAEGEARNNDAAFEQSFQHLEKKGLLFIAAEGVSWMERWVRPFKTGAARIAFGAESRNDWQLGVKIIPVGLSYSAANLFRSEVIVHFGPPIEVAPWAVAEQQSHEKAANDFTLEIEQKVRALVLDTRDAAGQAFIENIETVSRATFPEDEQACFSFRKNLVEQNIDNEALRATTASYFEALQTANITDDGLESLANPATSTQKMMDTFLLFAGLPFFLAGYTFWWLPCFLPWLLTKKMNLYIGYASNVKMLSGLFTFPLALWGAYRVAFHFYDSAWWGLAAIALVVLLGYFTEQYMDLVQWWQARREAEALREKEPKLFNLLLQQREDIKNLIQR